MNFNARLADAYQIISNAMGKMIVKTTVMSKDVQILLVPPLNFDVTMDGASLLPGNAILKTTAAMVVMKEIPVQKKHALIIR